MHRRTKLTTLLTAATLLPSLVSAQTDPQAEFGEELEVIEVFVDVLATDRRGNVVEGLTKDDFEVLENGEKRDITAVQFYSMSYDTPAPAQPQQATASVPQPTDEPSTPPTEIPGSRYFVLFFHDQSGAVTNQSQLTRNRLLSARDAKQWIETDMGPSDWVAVFRFDFKLSIHSDFTQDRGAIVAAIDSATMNKRTSIARPSAQNRADARFAPTLLPTLPDGRDLDRSSVRVEDAVRIVAEAARPIVGRKNLVMFTLGFGRTDSPLGDVDSRYYPEMAAALNDNNVAVYPIDLNGSGNLTSQNNFLSRMADDTGGEYYATFNRFLGPLEEITSSTSGYYLISFRSEVPVGEAGYRNFEVKSTNRKVRVKSRKGYRFGTGWEPWKLFGR